MSYKRTVTLRIENDNIGDDVWFPDVAEVINEFLALCKEGRAIGPISTEKGTVLHLSEKTFSDGVPVEWRDLWGDPPSWKSTLCLDFDGVCHEYTSKWEAPDVIADGPHPDLVPVLTEYLQYFNVAIYSSRSRDPKGIEAMKTWFTEHVGEELAAQLSFPTDKPPAHATIDDRGITFCGNFPSARYLLAFKPWNKQ
jgi:hypothetical protein